VSWRTISPVHDDLTRARVLLCELAVAQVLLGFTSGVIGTSWAPPTRAQQRRIKRHADTIAKLVPWHAPVLWPTVWKVTRIPEEGQPEREPYVLQSWVGLLAPGTWSLSS
jgi:hypothetical protein